MESFSFVSLNHFSLQLKNEVDDFVVVVEQLYWQKGDRCITFIETIDPIAIILLINQFYENI